MRVIGAVDDAAAEEGRDPSAPVTGSNWEYSAKAVALLLEYKTEFPNLFSNLERLGHEKKYSSEQAFGVNKTLAPALLAKLEEWLGRQYTAKAARTPLSTTSLSKDAMKAVERAADVRTSHLAAQAPERLVVKKVPLEAIFRVSLPLFPPRSSLLASSPSAVFPPLFSPTHPLSHLRPFSSSG